MTMAAAGLLTSAPAGAQPPPPGASVPAVRVAVPPPAAPAQAPGDVASESATELAKQVQNPIGNVYVLPFQNNTNFQVGPHKGTQDILNIQPVVPVHLNEDWKVITRTVLPVVWSPSFQPAPSVPSGLGATTFSAFLTPNRISSGWAWGVGPVVQIPTITDKVLGSNIWGLGPALVLVTTAGPVVAGVYANNVFSLGGTSGRAATKYGLLTVNPFLHYNFGDGWFTGSAPIITVNETAPGAKWTLPMGAQIGRLIKIGGRLPVNLLVGAYYNALRPESAARWQLRTVAAFIF
jgi:hypothetical protein